MLSERGQTLLELVVVIAVIVIVIGALTFSTIASLRNAQFAKNQAQATKLAQEALERVRTGRDRNQCISSLDTSVKSWNGNSSNSTCSGSGSLWDYQIEDHCGDTNPAPPAKPVYCYFKVDDQGRLTYLTASSTLPSAAEAITYFKRAIILSDYYTDDPLTYKRQKTVTAIVVWTDFSGEHESRLTTILRKI